VLQALMLPGRILQRAVERERIARNPARLVRKVKRGPRREVRPLAPVTVERLRAASRERDAVLISILAYAGLRPQEALALDWGHVRDRNDPHRARRLVRRAEGHRAPRAPHGPVARAAAGGSAGVAAVER
jgi:integrase